MDQIFNCQSLSKRYGGFLALDNVSLTLPKGQIIGLLGPNGSGKTTLLKLAAGLLTPNSGKIEIDGIPVGPQTKSIVSYLPERTYFDMGMRVGDCLEFFEDFYADFDRARAEEMLRLLNVPSDMKMKAMSKGTKEKVQLVMVMARRAKLYLLDEPIGGVDPAARDYILQTILQNYGSDSTILISTHLISDVENVLDSFVFIQKGKILCQDSVENVRTEHGMTLDNYFKEVFRCSAN